MPTDDIVNASEQTSQDPPANPEITDDLIKSHPLYQDLSEKHAAARQGFDQKSIELKKLKSAFLNDDEDEIEDEVLEPPAATKQDLSTMKDQIRWELKNEKQIELADKNGKFTTYLSEGITSDKALKLALFDEGITNDAARSESVRQSSVSAPSVTVDRSGGSSLEGFPDSYIQGMKDKGLSDTKIKQIINSAKDRAARRGR